MTDFHPSHPNPGFGNLSLMDIITAAGAIGRMSIEVFFFILGSVFKNNKNGDQKNNLRFFIQRRLLTYLPISVLRRPSKSLDKALSSKRYAGLRHSFIEGVRREDFSAIWFCNPKLGDTSSPFTVADMVILFAHGGGYVVGQPEMYTSLLMRVAEGIESSGRTIAICALDYALAPEYVFPRQLEQMTACWDYITTELGIPLSKIALIGDSAGGSLCLSLLAHMESPAPGVPRAKISGSPGMGVYLISPWVSLLSEKGYPDKEDTDVLDARALRKWAAMVTSGVDVSVMQKYLEFANSRDDLRKILPSRTWVSSGSDEVFLHNISAFVNTARASGCRVDFEVKDGQAHDWQLMETLDHEDEFLSQEYPVLGADSMTGAASIAKALMVGYNWKG
ncbi:alpha beta-hydrolase [Fusarium tjaetaba]|uniref:Alpha beta-hydrolase n=1 Tax=Fusarium tjaetaba TaxID=1567544 RepID=A0A8H5R2M6_9HYPO|nr:alpha beta-hydrolase [Fusarium tjaetaba]KAF5625193.1 alpha beta-hydrolase [Fusarium tjaetaba]